MPDLLVTPEIQRAWFAYMWKQSENDPILRYALLLAGWRPTDA